MIVRIKVIIGFLAGMKLVSRDQQANDGTRIVFNEIILVVIIFVVYNLNLLDNLELDHVDGSFKVVIYYLVSIDAIKVELYLN